MNSSRLAAPVFTEATSDAGTPSTWKITRAGSSHVSAATISARPSCEPVGDEAAHGVADEPLHLRDAAGREREVGDPTGAAVRGRVDVGERGDGAEAALDERGPGPRARRRHRGQAVGGREGLCSRSTRLQSA